MHAMGNRKQVDCTTVIKIIVQPKRKHNPIVLFMLFALVEKDVFSVAFITVNRR